MHPAVVIAYGQRKHRVEWRCRIEARMDNRIIIDPPICPGKPGGCGRRTPVTVILNALAGGDSFQTLEREYALTTDDIRACIAFAANEIEQLTFRPVKA